MRKIYALIILLIFFVLPFSLAINYFKFEYKNTENQYIENIEVIGFLCTDNSCLNSYVGRLFNGETVSSLTNTPNYDVVLSFPTNSEKPSNVNRYIFFSHNLNYLPYFIRLTPSPQLTGTLQNPIYSSTLNPVILPKISTCSSPISVSVVNNVRENLPVSVTSGAEMSSAVKSAYGFNGVVNVGWIRGSEFEQYYEVETTLRLKIYKYNSATSKNIGSPIHEENVVKRIYYDDTVNVAFTDWMPPPQTEQFTYYNITVESDVTDPKCSSKINQRASKIMRVWRDDPRNQCYSLIDTDGLVFSPVDFSNRRPEAGEEVTISFRKLSNYANDYEPWEPLFSLTPQDTNINLKLTGAENRVITQTLPKNPNENFSDASVKWVPSLSGTYTLEITADAATCPVISDTSSDPYIQTIFVFDPPKYDAKFTVKASENPVIGAKVMIINPLSEKFTSSAGVATFNLYRGLFKFCDVLTSNAM